MSDEDWLVSENQEDKPVPERAEPSGRAQRGRGSEQPEEPESNKNDESDWVTERTEEKPEEPPRRGRNRQEDTKPKVEEGISQIIQDPRKELTADPAQDTWTLEKEELKKAQEEEAPRGNRGNRGNRQDQNEQRADEPQSRGNRGNRESTGNEEGGNQGRNNDRNQYGGGGYRGGYRGGYNDNRDGDNQGDRGRGRGRGREGNRDFGNRQYNNRQGQDGQGGVRNNRFGGDRDNRDNRDNRDYRDNRDNRGPREYNNGSRNYPPNSNPNEQTVATVVQVPAVVVPKIQQVVPRGRKVWPECSIFIHGCRFTISYRQINETGAKCLVIPYSSLKLQFYPGNLINSSSVNYRKHIEGKGEEISKPGDIYIQKAKEVGGFEAVIFLKVVEGEMKECFAKGSKSVIERLGSLIDINIDDVVFPISEKMGDPADVILPLLENLENHKKIKQVFVSTNEAKSFHRAIEVFQSAFDKFVEDNQISIESV